MAGTRDAEIAALLKGLAVPGAEDRGTGRLQRRGGAMSEVHAERSAESPWGRKKCFKMKEMLERTPGGAGEGPGIHSDEWASPPDPGLPVGIYTSIGIPGRIRPAELEVPSAPWPCDPGPVRNPLEPQGWQLSWRGEGGFALTIQAWSESLMLASPPSSLHPPLPHSILPPGLHTHPPEDWPQEPHN